MSNSPLSFTCAEESDLHRLARALSPLLASGDLITLSGELGVGKTSFIRAVIRAHLATEDLEVPSPTFTLVQHYESECSVNIAHYDFYRLQSPSELDELGLEESLESGVAFIEWPDKGDIDSSTSTISITIDLGESDSRNLVLSASPERLSRFSRSIEIEGFLTASSIPTSHRSPLTGDASSRLYETIKTLKSHILMDSSDNIVPFVAIANLLSQHGFCVPNLHSIDYDKGLILMENLGSDQIKDSSDAPIRERYNASIELLVDLQKPDWPREVELDSSRLHRIDDYTESTFQSELDLLPRWYAPHRLGSELSPTALQDYKYLWRDHLSVLWGSEPSEQTLVLRDYHSPNILWRNDESGISRLGLLDFQDALLGPPSYDVASLVQDARIDIDENLESDLTNLYCTTRTSQGEFNESNFRHHLALMQAQRASKVLGIFVRLANRDGKDWYLPHLPRVEDYLHRALSHPKLEGLRVWYRKELKF